MHKPFFSVIIPTFNRRDFLKIAIDSVLSQTFKDFELIIIDDGSNDSTKELIKFYNDKRIKYFWGKNHGPGYARNRGVEQSKADFIAFLDSDDKWTKDKLQRTFDFIKTNPRIPSSP